MTSEWARVLFEPGEMVCHGSLYETSPRGVETLTPESPFFCINALSGARLDVNVASFRNLLVECDLLPVDAQLARIEGLRMPHSMATFSGGKSTHFLISLETPLPDKESYGALMRRLYRALIHADFPLDTSCKNPSRFTRTPGHVRADSGKEQSLLHVKRRVHIDELNQWLSNLGAPPVEDKELYRPTRWKRILSGRTQNFLLTGAPEGQKHNACAAAAADMAECGIDFDEALARIGTAPGISQARSTQDEVAAVVRWAYRKVEV